MNYGEVKLISTRTENLNLNLYREFELEFYRELELEQRTLTCTENLNWNFTENLNLNLYKELELELVQRI